MVYISANGPEMFTRARGQVLLLISRLLALILSLDSLLALIFL